MDDALKAAGAVGGLGIAAVLGVIGYRLATDDRMAWTVVVGLMLCVVLVLVIIAIRSAREMWVTRTAMLRVQNEASLIGMRSVALVKDASGPRGDPWSTLLASMPQGDVIDGVGHPVDFDPVAHNGGAE